MIFYEFELFGWIWADFNRFDWICVDLGWLERIAVDLEDRYKVLFFWVWKSLLNSCRNDNIFGWVWEDLDGFEQI